MNLVRPLALVLSTLLLAPAIAGAQTGTSAAKPAPAAKAATAAKLPAAILTAFQQSYPKATLKNAAKETENGKTVWEVESVDKGLSRDLIYSVDGTVVEVEEEVALANVPPAVTEAVKATYPTATIAKAEKLTAGGTVSYELALKGAAKKSIELTPDGKAVPAKPESKDEKEDKDTKKK